MGWALLQPGSLPVRGDAPVLADTTGFLRIRGASAAGPPGRHILSLLSMSLAVSAVIAPSSCLRCLLAAFCASLIAAAVAVGLGAPDRFAFDGLVAFAPLAGALALGCSLVGFRRRSQGRWAARSPSGSLALLHGFGTARRLDISGLGQVRLTVQREMRPEERSAGTCLANSPLDGLQEAGELVTLLPGAIVWPHCMVLHVCSVDSATAWLIFLPDSMKRSDFRALAVAVRALANGATE